jgi:hypothetical protein
MVNRGHEAITIHSFAQINFLFQYQSSAPAAGKRAGKSLRMFLKKDRLFRGR